jgi:GxxExxY protein
MSHGFSRIFADFSLASGIHFVVMNTSACTLRHSELTDKIIKAFYEVCNELGYGFLESTYREAMVVALEASGLAAAREVSVPVWFRGQKIGQYYADLMVNATILLELKTARTLEKAHEAQLLHYLRATDIEVGLLLNFGLHPQFRRMIFDNKRKNFRENPCESVARVLA